MFKTATKGSTHQALISLLALRDEEVNSLWGNCSKVIDENGKPLVVYHGSPTSEIKVFEINEALFGEGAFFTNVAEEALDYTGLELLDYEDVGEMDETAVEQADKQVEWLEMVVARLKPDELGLNFQHDEVAYNTKLREYLWWQKYGGDLMRKGKDKKMPCTISRTGNKHLFHVNTQL
ncbi:MAG: hypothetical protein Q4C05_02250 [Akkermansia sp.]|nr:hypothetical protein [Akkermansia sp.]